MYSSERISATDGIASELLLLRSVLSGEVAFASIARLFRVAIALIQGLNFIKLLDLSGGQLHGGGSFSGRGVKICQWCYCSRACGWMQARVWRMVILPMHSPCCTAPPVAN